MFSFFNNNNRNTCKDLPETPEGKRLLEMSRRRWYSAIVVDLNETRTFGVTRSVISARASNRNL
jgi:hypothetical protein